MIQIAKCKGCDKDIVWADLPDGGRVPLDPRPAVYILVRPADDGPPTATRANSGEVGFGRFYVTHFATCSKASEFSKGGKA